jgi:glycosyltransferase involved in cell wall biosynthesis
MHRWLAREAQFGKISLIHTHSLWMMPNVYAGWVARRYQTPLVVAPRGTLTEYSMSTGSWVKKLFWPLVQRPALMPVTCFHATCDAEHRDIRRMGFRQPVAIIPNGIDEVPASAMSSRDERTILYLGRIHPEKGVDRLLRAWADVERQAGRWRLRIVGSGDPAFVEEMRALSASLGLVRCEISGPLYGEDKIRAYEECDVYVLPSVSENFAVTVAEALSSGRPVICTKGAPWEGLRYRHAGWWIDVDVESLSAALREATVMSREHLGRMGANGREWMKEEFLWNRIGQNMRSLYSWILHGGSRPGFVVTD